MHRPVVLLSSLIAALAAALATPAIAQVAVKEAWARATVAKQTATGVFMQLVASKDSRLVEARSSAANIVEIHEMAMVENVMKMRAVDAIDLPGGKAVDLKPGGYHVMLIDIKAPIKVGDKVPVTLVIEDKDKKRQTVEVSAVARPLGAAADKKH